MTDSETGEDSINRNYFQSYEDIEIHKLMLEDKPRTEAYRDAIAQNASLFKDKVVMDVGAGSGILSLFAAQAGAKRVYAVEASAISVPLRKIVELNGFEGVIQVTRGAAEDIDIPEKVDIMISEWMGFYLFHESMLNSFIQARDKHLNPEAGFVFPSHASLFIAPASLPSLGDSRKGYWKDVYGFNMTPMLDNVLMKPEIQIISESDLLSPPKTIVELNLSWVREEDVREISQRELFITSKGGDFNSVVLWFDVRFDASSIVEDDDSVVISTLSTGPACPPTHWKQTIIPLEASKSLQKNDKILYDISLEQSKGNCRQYVIELEILDETDTELHPVPCECHSYRCDSALTLLKALNDADD